MKFNPNQTNSFSTQHSSSIRHEQNWGSSYDGIVGPTASAKIKDEKTQSNLKMLQRAYGSQIDLTGVGPVELRSCRRSVECQTEYRCQPDCDSSLIGRRLTPPSALSNELNQVEDSNVGSNASSPSHSPLWTITEQKTTADADDMTIIINLGNKKTKKTPADQQ